MPFLLISTLSPFSLGVLKTISIAASKISVIPLNTPLSISLINTIGFNKLTTISINLGNHLSNVNISFNKSINILAVFIIGLNKAPNAITNIT